MTRVVIPAQLDGARLDRALLRLAPGRSRRVVLDVIAQGLVSRAGRVLRKGDAVYAGEHLDVPAGWDDPWLSPSPDPRVAVLSEDAGCVVVHKPAAMHCHPLRPGEGGTLLDAVVHLCPAVATAGPTARDGGLLHRLDVDTTGAVSFAKTPEAYRARRADFAQGRVRKVYLAVTRDPPFDARVIDRALRHHAHDPRRMVVEGQAPGRGPPQPARSSVRVLARADGLALVEVETHTGRRHQVRVHLASAGAPLLGDALYDGPRDAPADGVPPGDRGRVWLHAARLVLPKMAAVCAPVPADRRARLEPGAALILALDAWMAADTDAALDDDALQ